MCFNTNNKFLYKISNTYHFRSIIAKAGYSNNYFSLFDILVIVAPSKILWSAPQLTFIWFNKNFYDIIFNESAELKKQLKEKEEQLQLKENDLQSQKLLVKKKDKELKQMAKKISLDWLSDNVQGVSKIGITEEILKRIDGHL